MTENEREAPEIAGWQQIGDIAVDSAQLVLIDPQYAGEVAGYVMDATLTFEPVANELGIPVAVVVGTGMGDGLYPVEARFEEADGALRIAEVRIQFIGPRLEVVE